MYGTWELWWLSGADFLSLRQIYTYVYMISCIVSYTCNAVFFSAHSSQCRWHETLILRMSTRIFLQLDLGWSKNHQLATSTRVIQKVTESYTLLLEHVCLFYMRWHDMKHSSWGCQHESFCSLIWVGAKTINWPHQLGIFKKLEKVRILRYKLMKYQFLCIKSERELQNCKEDFCLENNKWVYPFIRDLRGNKNCFCLWLSRWEKKV